MTLSIATVALVVRDYDEALAWYTRCLGFACVEDSPRGEGKRWVVVAPPGGSGVQMLLAQASGAEQASRIGNQTGGRVGFFLRTDDFWRDYEAMRAQGVRFAEAPRTEAYGTVVVFEDLYGNRWDLLQLGPLPVVALRAT
jgi:catechol 2,3-dioxygenase-like lactoylglutathione lyase family enzyme